MDVTAVEEYVREKKIRGMKKYVNYECEKKNQICLCDFCIESQKEII
jgi:DTW domain-containing protein YfiP